MSYLTNAHNFNIGSLTIAAGTHVYNGGAQTQSPRDYLYSKIAPGAIHDSEERCDAPQCHPETRRAVQEDIICWIGDEDGEGQTILWLSGPAGAGKTAIAGSIAEACECEGILAATFFFSSFSGSENRRFKRSLIPTLAYQLAQLDGLEGYEDLVLTAIRRNPAIFDKQLKSQLDVLILKPLRHLRRIGGLTPSARVIILDGIDEVESPNSRHLERREARLANEADQVDILSCLLQATADPAFPFRIVVASRPERVIRDFFQLPTSIEEIFLDKKYDPGSDITLFLKAKFAQIRRRYKLSPSWPSDEDIDKLVDTASGQFVYAANVVRFLQNGKHPDPQGLLCAILDFRSWNSSVGHDALEPLDALYTQILMSSPNPPLAAKWLGAISNGWPMSALLFRQLSQDFEGEADYLIENLASIVHLPVFDDSESHYMIYHKSLRDFFMSQRCDRALGRAFYEGWHHFMQTRFVQVLRAKRTRVPLVESQSQGFYDQFLRVLTIFYGPGCEEMRSVRDDLGGCDVAWWVNTIIEVFTADPECAVRCISQLFNASHLPCLQNRELSDYHFRDCENSCKHWRSNIFRACRAMQWCLPDAVSFLREIMWYYSSPLGTVRPRSSYLIAPSHTEDSTNLSISVFHALPPTSYDIDGEYQSLCELTYTMVSRLPHGWALEYQRDTRMPSGIWNQARTAAIEHYIKVVQRELGVALEDDTVGGRVHVPNGWG